MKQINFTILLAMLLSMVSPKTFAHTGSVVTNISESQKAEALAAYEEAMKVYEECMACNESNLLLCEQLKSTSLAGMAIRIQKRTYVLESEASDAHLPEKMEKFYLSAAAAIRDSVEELAHHYIYEFNLVMDYQYFSQYYTEALTASYDRLCQYKERIEVATTADELSALIEEIKQDTAGMSEYLEEFKRANEILTREPTQDEEILEEVTAVLIWYSNMLEEYITEVEVADYILNNAVAALEETIEVYRENFDFSDFMKIDANYYANKVTESYWGINSRIETIKAKISESGIDGSAYAKTLPEIAQKAEQQAASLETVAALTDDFCKKMDSIIAILYEIYAPALDEYWEKIEGATRVSELYTIINEIEQYKDQLLQMIPRDSLMRELDELDKQIYETCSVIYELEAQLKEIEAEIDAAITGISATTVDTDAKTVTVYTLDGKGRTMKKADVQSLPSGVYIVNGKKVVVK